MIVLVGPDARSVRAFEARIESRADLPEFYRNADAEKAGTANAGRAILMDSLTGSGWNFRGCAVSGPAAGQCLRPVPAIKDYWFDWQIYHPKTTVNTK